MYTYTVFLALVQVLVAFPTDSIEKSTVPTSTNVIRWFTETMYTETSYPDTSTNASLNPTLSTSNVGSTSTENLSACSCSGDSFKDWMEVASFNMSDPTQECPDGLNFTTSPVRGCGRYESEGGSCDSVFFETNGRSFSKVCGRVHAFQRGGSSAFYNTLGLNLGSIEETYVSGVSLTHGGVGNRTHIWTFAGAQSDNYVDSSKACACSNRALEWRYDLPEFIGDDYFCDSGFRTLPHDSEVSTNNLWDGEGCGSSSSCCNNGPFFCKSLEEATSDDLELRLCSAEDIKKEDKYISLIEIYVQ